ncbi:MAG: penicillin-binding protein [Oligoflexia bacterium]|nr:MAG: penicillin-binding protein [Oligoflexia bacterium]
MKSRILLIFSGIILLWSLLIIRAAYLQIIPNERLKALHERQFQTVVTLQSRRGAIVDRKGRDLALSATAYSLYADPQIIEKPKALAKKLAKELGVSFESIYSKIKDDNRRFVWLSRLLPKDKADEIKSWDIRGLAFVEEYKRVYPNEKLLAQTIGFVGNEGQGLEGLELIYDQQLRSSKKKVSVRRDARGRPLVAEGMMFAENPDGTEIRLTVDSEIQHMLETELKEAIQEFDAEQAFAVVLDAQTSAVVALASAPTLDANNAMRASPETRRNRIVTDTFEPGSTMKTFAIATALREKIVTPNKKYNTENGMMKVGDRTIREADVHHSWSHLTVSEILAVSSNIGTTKIAFDLGEEKLRQGLNDFGFGAKSGIDLPGEAKGTLHKLPWNQHLLSNISFGQGITATPLQVANAYAAIANGGILNTPFIVGSVRDPETGEVKEVKPKQVRRVLSPEEAAQMRLILAGVTAPGGTGANAKVDGFVVAGKTGTAQKVNPNGRGYLPKAYVSSFAGFIPASDPKFVIYVAVDHPKKNAYYGSQVAAPIFSRVASYAARKEGLAPLLLSEKNLVPSVNFTSKEVSSAKMKTKNKKEVVVKKDPRLAERIKEAKAELKNQRDPSAVATSAELLSRPESKSIETVPDLKSLTAREVLRRMTGKDVEVRFVGSGVVAEVVPAVGTVLDDNKRITVYLK